MKNISLKKALAYWSDERENGDGVWLYLRKGFINSEAGIHCYHEQTKKECLEQFKIYTKVCDCDWCESN
jgi:hypothetical protein